MVATLELAPVGAREGDYLTRLRLQVSDAGLADVVRLVPATEDVLPWYHAADACVLASLEESRRLSVTGSSEDRLVPPMP